MLRKLIAIPLVAVSLLSPFVNASTKPRVWVVTDIQVGGHGDPDDDVTMGALLLLADHYQIEGITVGSSDRYSGGTKQWCENTFYADYLREVDSLNREYDGAYQTEIEFHMASTSGHVFSELHPETRFEDFLELYPSIRDMITAAEDGPVYVLNWGLLTEVSLAVKYCLEQGKIDTLKNLRIISHWTQRHGRWNCDTDNDACNYIHDQARDHDEVIMYELGPSGQKGMVENICNIPGELDRELMLNSRIGRYLDAKWIGHGKQKGMPDFSDGATFLALMGFGGGLDFYGSNGVVADQDKANQLFCADRPKIFALLEERAIAAAGQRPQGPTLNFSGPASNLPKVIDSAPAGSTLVFDSGQAYTFDKPIRIEKPITLKGLNARLPDGLGNSPLVIVESEGVSLFDLEVHGNYDSVDQEARASLISIHSSDFRVERCALYDSSKDGIEITPLENEGDIIGGIVRDIKAYRIGSDAVSISGGKLGKKVRNVLIENVRLEKGHHRGAIEVSDGADNILVRDVHAENALYAVDVQDHRGKSASNTNITLENITAVSCENLLRTDNSPRGRAFLTLSSGVAKNCKAPIRISNTHDVLIKYLKIEGHRSEKSPPALFSNCQRINLRGPSIQTLHFKEEPIVTQNSSFPEITNLKIQ